MKRDGITCGNFIESLESDLPPMNKGMFGEWRSAFIIIIALVLLLQLLSASSAIGDVKPNLRQLDFICCRRLAVRQ